MKKGFVYLFAIVSCPWWGWAQQVDTVAKLGYPQTILHNGKIVTMDDASFRSQVGTIGQAMAIRDGKILAIGNNTEVQALAGPQTKQIDLKGRTVLPNFILTHEHPTEWGFIEPTAFRRVLPNDDVIISRWMTNRPPKEQMALFEPTMREAVAKAKSGQWIRLIFNWGPDYEWAAEMQTLFNKSITKEWLNELAPNNPVTVKNGFITSIINAKAAEEFKSVFPPGSNYVPQGYFDSALWFKEAEASGNYDRAVDTDIMFKGKFPLLADVLKAEFELWARHGITTFSSTTYSNATQQALAFLDQKGQMPSRYGWAYSGPTWETGILQTLQTILGHGTDHLWNVGAWSEDGGPCMSVPLRSEWVQQMRQENPSYPETERCYLEPGVPRRRGSTVIGREILEKMIENGLRIATMHTGGDKDIDFYLDAIEQASKRAGFTLEEIRAKRHAFDHSSGAPRPEQIPRIKNLGVMVSQLNTVLWETHRGASMIAKMYGLEYTSWVAPRKSLTEAGVMTTFEIDRPLPHKVFFFILKGMNRYNDRDQKVYGPGERTDRITQLKALTTWGSYYVLRENLLGSLEPGKFADFIVLDRDFLTIPEVDIPKTQVLMTVVGGKTVHVGADLAREIGMQPVGPTTWKEPIPEGWEPKPY
ncbi:MAG: amidohydrolase family protein [Acidobacteria bacterium]|nr:amidohydrolase family protein [Acidobacteriota bacterium]